MRIVDTLVCSSPDCKRAGKPQKETEFYNTYSSTMKKYPICKSCLKRIIDPDNVESVTNILKEMDAPFLYELWHSVYDTIEDKTRVFGNYLKKILTLTQYKNLRYKDSIFEKKVEVRISDGEELIYDSKWNASYTRQDLDYLNNYLDGLNKDYKISTTNHLDYAKKIAKASLALDKEQDAVNRGDGSQASLEKLSKTFDTLSKSAQFAESNRDKKDLTLSSFSTIFELVEKKTFIPKFEPIVQDTYDLIIDQIATTNKSM